MLRQKIFKFRGSEMLFSALSTAHFEKYERKCKWLVYVLPISGVVVKVQCMLTERKVKQPSRKLQAKDEISSLYDSRLSLSSLRKENIPSDEE